MKPKIGGFGITYLPLQRRQKRNRDERESELKKERKLIGKRELGRGEDQGLRRGD